MATTVRTVEPGITIVELTGRLNMGKNLTAVEEELEGLVQGGTRKLILDLSGLEYVDSASLGMLTGVRKQIVEAGGSIRLAGARGITKRTLEVIHMSAIMPVDADLESAISAMSA